MQKELKLELSHGVKVRIAIESLFSIAKQDIALVPLEDCSSRSYRHRLSSKAKGRVPSTGLLDQLPPPAAGFPDISQVQIAQPFLDCCFRHNHQIR